MIIKIEFDCKEDEKDNILKELKKMFGSKIITAHRAYSNYCVMIQNGTASDIELAKDFLDKSYKENKVSYCSIGHF